MIILRNKCFGEPLYSVKDMTPEVKGKLHDFARNAQTITVNGKSLPVGGDWVLNNAFPTKFPNKAKFKTEEAYRRAVEHFNRNMANGGKELGWLRKLMKNAKKVKLR